MTQIISPTYSWEYVASLSYEWNVIRGYQRYRWTIWVRDGRFTLNFPLEGSV
jgi:hypothetical protein